jgi:hypothetical protein
MARSKNRRTTPALLVELDKITAAVVMARELVVAINEADTAGVTKKWTEGLERLHTDIRNAADRAHAHLQTISLHASMI